MGRLVELSQLLLNYKGMFMVYGAQIVSGFCVGIGFVLAVAAMRVAFHISLLGG